MNAPVHRRQGWLRILWLVGSLLACSNTYAFNTPGHFATVALIVGSPAFDDLTRDIPGRQGQAVSSSEKQLIAACSQLPDMAKELDATATFFALGFFSKLEWLLPGYPSSLSQEESQMLITQQLIHGLTGGEVMALRPMALDTVNRLFLAWLKEPRVEERGYKACALGFALHLYGDSFAHSRIARKGDTPTGVLYNTGYGHADPGHYPDYVLCNQLIRTTLGATVCDAISPSDTAGRVHEWFEMAFHVQMLNEIADLNGARTNNFKSHIAELEKQSWQPVLPTLKSQKLIDGRPKCSTDDACFDDSVGVQLLKIAADQKYLPNWELGDFTKYNDNIQHSGIAPDEKPCEVLLACQRQKSPAMNALFNGGEQHACSKIWQQFGDTALGNMRKCSTPAAGSKAACVVSNLAPIYEKASPKQASVTTAGTYMNLVFTSLNKGAPATVCPF